MPILDRADVLIIGAGASGAAVAWSLAETRMRILCLEQGDWVKPTDYPSNGRDWEARQFTDFNISPNIRSNPADYPINDDNSPIKVVNFNGVGGGTILYAGHFPRLHPSDFRVQTLDGVGDDWPIDYKTLEPWFGVNEQMMGISGLAGDPAYPPKASVLPPVPLGLTGTTYGRASTNSAGTGGPQTPPSPHVITRVVVDASISVTVCMAAHKAPRQVPTSPTGRKPFVNVSSCGPMHVSVKSPWMKREWPTGRCILMPRALNSFNPPTWSSLRATVLAHHASCSTRKALAFRAVWRIQVASLARTSCSTPMLRFEVSLTILSTVTVAPMSVPGANSFTKPI